MPLIRFILLKRNNVFHLEQYKVFLKVLYFIIFSVQCLCLYGAKIPISVNSHKKMARMLHIQHPVWWDCSISFLLACSEFMVIPMLERRLADRLKQLRLRYSNYKYSNEFCSIKPSWDTKLFISDTVEDILGIYYYIVFDYYSLNWKCLYLY